MPGRTDGRNILPVGFFLSTIGILIVGAIADYAIGRAVDAGELAIASAVRMAAIERLHQRMLDAESTGRLFLVRGEPRFRDDYRKKLVLIDDELRGLHEKLRETPEAQRKIDELEQRAHRRFAFLDGLVALRTSSGTGPLQDGPITPGVAEMAAISATVDEMKRAEALNLGARMDTRRRQIRTLELGLAGVMVLGVLIMAVMFRYMDRLWHARVAAEESARQLAHHDALTGLPNRRLLDDRMGLDIARAKRYGNDLAVLCLDLDGFKAVNDTLGHDAGDEVLRQVASRLTKVLRKEDTVARLGGDEFVVALAQLADPSYATGVARKIIETVSQPYDIGGESAAIGTSVGIALYPRHGKTQQELMRAGDTALYAAKAAGKSRYTVAA